MGVNYKVINKIVTYLEFTYKKDMIVDMSFVNDLAPTIKDEYLKITTSGKFTFDCFDQMNLIANLHENCLKDLFYDKIN